MRLLEGEDVDGTLKARDTSEGLCEILLGYAWEGGTNCLLMENEDERRQPSRCLLDFKTGPA